MCHGSFSLPSCDVGDLHFGVFLTVTLTLAVARLVLELHDRDLGTLGGSDYLGAHRHTRQGLGVTGDLLVVTHEQCRKGDRAPRLAVDLVDPDDVADRDLLLPAAGTDNRVHRELLRFGVSGSS